MCVVEAEQHGEQGPPLWEECDVGGMGESKSAGSGNENGFGTVLNDGAGRESGFVVGVEHAEVGKGSSGHGTTESRGGVGSGMAVFGRCEWDCARGWTR